MSGPRVEAVAAGPDHAMAKPVRVEVRLLAGFGIEGDAHAGSTVKHRSRVRRDPTAPNLRQVHLLAGELLDELRARGFAVVEPGRLGENILTRDLDLLALPTGSLLRLGAEAVVEVTGLRNPCGQLEAIQPGLQAAVLGRGPGGEVLRRAGVMAVVRAGGPVRPGDPIAVEPGAGGPLQPV